MKIKLFFVLLFLLSFFSSPAWPQTTYYNVTAEQAYSPICALTNATTQWTQCESKVTRSSNQAKSGSFAIRGEVITDGVQPGTCGEGNCTGHATHWTNPSSGLAAGATDLPQDLYFSTWFFFPSSGTEGIGWPDNGNWQIWRNFFEFKNDNDSNYQDGEPQLEGRCCKIAVSFQHLDTPTATRRWMIALKDPKWTNSPTQAQQDFAMDYFDGAAPGMHNLDTACCGEDRPSDWYSDAFTVPLDDWVFFEMHVKFATTNGVIAVWTGTASTGLIKIFEFQDVDLNTLKAIDEAGSNAWSTNKYLMWSVNNYMSDSNPAGTYVLYHDDTRITDFQVGPTLPEFGGGDPGSTFPQVEASTTSSMGTAVTSHTVALPAGIVSGELLKVIFAVHATGDPTVTPPAGWSTCKDITTPLAGTPNTKIRTFIMYKAATGSEGSSVTFTTSVAKRSAHWSARISGAPAPASRPPECSTGATASTGNPDPDNLVPTDGTQDYLFLTVASFGVVLTPGCAATINTYPTDYVSGVQQNSGGGSDAEARIGVARRELNAASEDPGAHAFSCTDAPWSAVTVSVPPDLPEPPSPPTSLGIGGVSGNF